MPGPTACQEELLREAIADLDAQRYSACARKAARLARLRRDYENLLWLELQFVETDDGVAKRDLYREVARCLPRDRFEAIVQAAAEDYSAQRQVNARSVGRPHEETNPLVVLTLPGLERELKSSAEYIKELRDQWRGADEMTRQAIRYRLDAEGPKLREFTRVLDRIVDRLRRYLARVEEQIAAGKGHSDLFEAELRFVETGLKSIAPAARAELRSALARLQEGTPEALSQALLSCRRSLHFLANALYPARTDPVRGGDGTERVLSDDKYIARLWQFVAEAKGSGSARDQLKADVEELGGRIDRLYDQMSKGVHATVSLEDARYCVLQTVVLVAQLLRLRAGEQTGVDSAAAEPA